MLKIQIISKQISDDKYMRLIEEELKVLKALRGKRKSDRPELPVQPPELPVQTSELPAEHPEFTVHSPELPVQPPDLPAQPPEFPAEFTVHSPDSLPPSKPGDWLENAEAEPKQRKEANLHQDGKHDSAVSKEYKVDKLSCLERDCSAEPDKIQKSNLNSKHQTTTRTDFEPEPDQTGFYLEPENNVCPANLEFPFEENDLRHFCPSKP